MQVNLSVVEHKIKEKISAPISMAERYQLGEQIFKLINLGNPELAQEIHQKKIKELYRKAELAVAQLLAGKVVIVPEHNFRTISLIYPNESQDKSGSFFEINLLAERLGQSDLEKLFILGFFMSEERMTIIQAYNLSLGLNLEQSSV